MLISAPCRWQGLERSMHMAALEQSKTRINLMRAFAGESQARNRYTFAAQLARGQRLEVVAEAFDLTARQEQEHAEIFYGFLAPLNGTNPDGCRLSREHRAQRGRPAAGRQAQ